MSWVKKKTKHVGIKRTASHRCHPGLSHLDNLSCSLWSYSDAQGALWQHQLMCSAFPRVLSWHRRCLRDLNSDWKNPLLLCSGNDCLVSSCMWPSTLHPLSHVAKYNTILPLPNGLKLLWTALNEAILHYCTFAWCQRAPCASGWKPLGCDKTLVSDSLHVRTRRTWDKMGRAPE